MKFYSILFKRKTILIFFICYSCVSSMSNSSNEWSNFGKSIGKNKESTNKSKEGRQYYELPGASRNSKYIIEISTGKIKGVASQSRDGRHYYEFLGIPYAKPPVGELRFESPQPPEPWDVVLAAENYRSECIQVDVSVTGRFKGEEDCLYLNVYTPKLRPKNLMPVFMFLHGGLYMSGSADLYKGKYFMDEDIVLVTINYRLGALGFLSTGDGVVRGNMGLRDQILALKWIQENIRKFGGNPNNVVLFGESAGAACVQYLMISPLANGLFHKGISQSGAATRKYLLTDNQNLQAKHFAAQVQCPITDTNSEDMVKCLKEADAETIVRVHREAVTPERNQYSLFGPIVEYLKDSEAVLTEDSTEALKNGNFTHMPWMAGVNSAEGLLYVAQILRDRLVLDRLDDQWSFLLAKLLKLNPDNFNVTQKVRQYYFRNALRLDIKSNIQMFTNMFSDRYFYQPISQAAHIHAKYAPVYLYYFSQKTPITIYDLVLATSPGGLHPPEVEVATYMSRRWLTQNLLRAPSKFYGACHGDELSMIFNTNLFSEVRKRSSLYKFSRAMVKLWADFARDDSEMTFEGIPWNPLRLDEPIPVYMDLNSNARLVYEPFTQRIKFWESLNIQEKE